MEFRDINEYAPPDGVLLLVIQDGGYCLRERMNGEWWTEANALDDSGLDITHWAELPERPR